MLSEVILSTRYAGRVAIVHLQGRFTLGPALHRVKPRIDSVLSAKSSTGLVLNLAGVDYIDSSGLGELVAIHASAMRRRAGVVLACVPARIQELLSITRLDGIFTLCADETSALQHLAQSKIPDQP
jgi:anti-sigma B factor antagonist